MKLWIWLFVALTCACGVPPKKYLSNDLYRYSMKNAPSAYLNPEIMTYVNDFLQLLHNHGVRGDGSMSHLRHVDFGAPETAESWGSCSFNRMPIMGFDKEDYSVIMIDPAAKDEGPLSLRAVIYHESAHCLFSVDHSPDGNSLMFAVAHDEAFLEEHFNTMADNLAQGIADGNIEKF